MNNIILTRIVIACFVAILGILPQTHAQQQNYLNAKGNKLYDTRGKEVRFTGVNWFGFETALVSPHGIWSRDTKSVLQQIKDLGFNTIRIPWCNEMLAPDAEISINPYGSDPYTGVSPMNEIESTLTKPIELMDVIVDWCQANEMKIILDNHSRNPDAFLEEALWYTDNYPEEKWIEDWVFMADRYKGKSAVVGMDLNNEPHGKSGLYATWGDSNPATDWNKAAERCGNAILEVNPDVLIIVEGVEKYKETLYWWGGNLKGAKDFPVQLSNPDKLMYSPHEYGPEVYPQNWFAASDFPGNLDAQWADRFGYLYDENISPLLIGEFGVRDFDFFNGTAGVWFQKLMKDLGSKYSWTFWSMNPNSTDTGGILQEDWSSVHQYKLDVLIPHMDDYIPNVIDGNGSGVLSVKLTQPTNGKQFQLGKKIRLKAEVVEGEAPIARVAFLVDGKVVKVDKKEPYVFPWVDAAIGEYALTARVTDSDGKSKLSDPIQVSVLSKVPPAVSIGRTTVDSNGKLTVTVDATDEDGLVNNVVLLVDGKFVERKKTAPYTFELSNLSEGEHMLMARAVDNDANKTLSKVVTVEIGTAKDAAAKFAEVEGPKVLIYPNPSEGDFVINVTRVDEVSAVVVMDGSGREIVKLKKDSFEEGKLNVGQDLKPGVYFLKVISSLGTNTIKLLKK